MKKNLIKFRVDKDLNQSSMAKVIGKSQSLYCRKENGEVPFDELEIRAIQSHFNLSKNEVADLIFDE